MKEKKARVEDALHATRAARRGGNPPGRRRGSPRCILLVEGLKLEGDEAVGAGIIRRALEAPIRQIAENAGVDGAIVVQTVRNEKRDAFGFNAASGEYEDLVAAGVIDPTKVVRTALQNAASVATMLLTTDALICEIKEDKPAGAPRRATDPKDPIDSAGPEPLAAGPRCFR